MRVALLSAKSLAGIAWISVFAVIWLWILGVIPTSAPNVASFVFFLVVAVMSSAIASPKKST